MIKINDEIIATAEQNIVITQANYDKLTTAEKNNPLKTYFISDSSIAAQNLVANAPAVQPMSLDDDDLAAGVDDSDGTVTNGTGTEYVVADKDGNVVGPMEDQEVGSTDFVDTDLIGLNIADAIGNASVLASYGGDGTIIGAIADLYKRLGVEPDTSGADADDAPLTYSDYLGMIGDRSVLDQFNMPNVTAALMDLFDRIADAENKAEIARVNAEDAMKAQAEAEAAQAAAEKAKAETEKDLANATNRADNAEASASDAWKQLHDTTEELNAEKTKNERLQSELDAAKKSEENKAETTEPGESTGTETTAPSESTDTTEPGETTDTDKGDTTPPESTDETTPGSSEDKSTSEGESTDTVTGEPDASTETTKKGESTETSGTTDQSSETTESPEETTTENKSEETVETPSTESTEEPSVKEETSSETTTPTTEDSAPASSDEEK